MSATIDMVQITCQPQEDCKQRLVVTRWQWCHRTGDAEITRPSKLWKLTSRDWTTWHQVARVDIARPNYAHQIKQKWTIFFAAGLVMSGLAISVAPSHHVMTSSHLSTLLGDTLDSELTTRQQSHHAVPSFITSDVLS